RYVYIDKYKMDILAAFRKFDQSGKVEIITCCATHGYLPLMEIYEPAVRAQVKVAVDTYRGVFGHAPKGMWLPECGYQPGHDEILKEFGVQYFVTDTHGVIFASPRPRFGVHNPYLCPSGAYVFGRDSETSKAVWSAKEGYPGHPDYREFYRDIGYDLDHGYLAPYLNGDGSRRHTGIKYWRITGDTNDKHLYVPEWAKATADSHADNFVFNRECQVDCLFEKLGRKPIILAPYDAELYGHWWFEGVEWLDRVIRKVAAGNRNFGLITTSQYLNLYKKYQPIRPSMSSWGYKGYSEVWINGSNDWIYRHRHKITEYMIALADKFENAEGSLRLALNQLARELLLAQSSDWAFMMKNDVFVEYAQKRVSNHIEEFLKIYHMIEHNDIDEDWIAKRYAHYNIFPDIDYSVYRSSEKSLSLRGSHEPALNQNIVRYRAAIN
ncbi:MAG: 1,4-alpha-glucan branching protein domain-containing protein, partial [Candidatus Omnitrophota bacterium]